MRKAFLLILLWMSLAAVGCASDQSTVEPTPTPRPTAVKPIFKVERGNMVIRTTLGGRAVPQKSAGVAFATDGEVGNVFVQVGDYVEQGQLLADLAVLKDLETQWAKASADAQYEETLSNNTLKRAEIKLQIAQLNLEDLKAKGASPAARQMAELQVQLAQMDLDEIKANPALHEAAQKAKELEQQMTDAQLKAPVAGYVVEAPSSGRSVRTTTSAFQIGDARQLEIGAPVMEEELKQLTEGMTVTVVFEGKPDKTVYVGTIRALPYPYGTGANGGTDIRVTVADAPVYQLGDRVLITAVLQEKDDVLSLPPRAIREVGGRTFVMLPDGQRVDVTLGLHTNDQVEIAAGLSEGQVVVGP